jgi:hypothetical protein
MGQQLLSFTGATLPDNEKLYFVKIGLNFVGLAVIRENAYEKHAWSIINKHKHQN